MMGLRLGDHPQHVMTTTPKPYPWLRAIRKMPGTVVTTGTTYENRDNLAKTFFSSIITKYEGTRLGQQELMAEDNEDTAGALWTSALLDQLRVDRAGLPQFHRVIVGVDPSVADPKKSMDETTAECGIVVAGVADVNHPSLGPVPTGYVLADRSLRAHPNEWAKAAIAAYREFAADAIVAERNNGGELVASVIKSVDPSVNVILVHASKGKFTRAEPIASFYEQRRVSHLKGADLTKLESQMCNWVPGLASPDRMDALVWALTELLTMGTPIRFGPHPFEEWRSA